MPYRQKAVRQHPAPSFTRSPYTLSRHHPYCLPPADIFGKVDTDLNGSLSKDELKTLAENIKKTTGQTLDVGDEAIKALDQNGGGELSPDEIDLRKTLSLNSADLGGDNNSNGLNIALDSSPD